MPRPQPWNSVDHYVSGNHLVKTVSLVLKVRMPGSPQGNRRSIIHTMSPEEARTMARSLLSMADRMEQPREQS